MFNYIIKAQPKSGEPRIGIPVKSEMNLLELQDYVRSQCEPLHPNSRDVVYRYSVWELVNPKVMTPSDYANFGPIIL